MKEFEVYSPEGIITSNLSETAKRFCFLTEQEISHMYDLAHEVVQDGDVQEILISLQEQKLPPPTVPEDTLTENGDIILRTQRFLGLQRSLVFCRALCDLLQRDNRLSLDVFFPDVPQSSISSPPRIAYQKSSYADSAYLQFSSCLEKTAAAKYAHSFIAACEEVYNGLSDYCILPLENSSEGLLQSFVKLILRYDLKIAATCDVYENRENRFTKFALLRRGLFTPFSYTEQDLFFELALSLSESLDASDLLTAARFFDLPVSNVTYIPFAEDKQTWMLHVTFAATSGELEPFLVYLCMEAPGYLPIGIYPHITSKKERT